MTNSTNSRAETEQTTATIFAAKWLAFVLVAPIAGIGNGPPRIETITLTEDISFNDDCAHLAERFDERAILRVISTEDAYKNLVSDGSPQRTTSYFLRSDGRTNTHEHEGDTHTLESVIDEAMFKIDYDTAVESIHHILTVNEDGNVSLDDKIREVVLNALNNGRYIAK